jgi:hypothetical protein
MCVVEPISGRRIWPRGNSTPGRMSKHRFENDTATILETTDDLVAGNKWK